MHLVNYILTILCTSVLWFGLYMHKLLSYTLVVDNLKKKLFTSSHAYDSLLSQYNILKSVIGSTYTPPPRPAPPVYTAPLASAYKALGLATDASTQEIKNKYRMLVKKYHPDINKTKAAPAKFKVITEAYKLITSSR